ncbi:leucyl aminopeptidase [Cryobacterium mesophilum]|uniref:Probable cytosol aminopeptidase n=1 Tax=Terrimesophilobacter mesophilus TaxID=433647 RepID=A0A4R8V7V5_9MICO|nr:leucyl aminopeptidase [Terrimesophilobacter mesophilus]MBB5631815.1 leucyl aminopeptidase [Terrimesophilobacter mesophilus]TFB78733.1 leucyl aminopeptidase [Terrimesophilobacter mesophilus]
MTVAALHLSSDSVLSVASDVLVLGVTSSDSGPTLQSSEPALQELAASLAALGVTGAEDELRRLATPSSAPSGAPRSIALIGLGTSPVTPHVLRRAAGSAARQVLGAASMSIALPATSEEDVLAILEGAAIGSYSFTRYRSQPKDASKLPASDITVISAVSNGSGAVDRARIVAGVIHSVRDLVNTPPLDLYPETFAAAAQELAVGAPVTVTVLADAELASGGFGGIIGVGQGSTRSPRLVKVEYSPEGAHRHLALVGKGITFDSGGLSLKPAASMVGMKYDMTGAATVLAVAIGAARLGLDIKVTAWLCIAENLPSGSAIRPNDVLTIRGGKTVEVLNTDAEGRLVLADGLVAASEEHPDAIIDVATLTGAARVALGDRYVGVMGDDTLVTEVVDTAKSVGESFWPMPLPAELRTLLNSDVADIANAKIGSTAAGMLLAGVFLQEFVGKAENGSRIPWAHLDIAGPAHNDGAGFGYTGKGPTAVTVRTLLALAERISRA